MRTSLRVNLHCHSDHSDGQLPPEEVAERLVRSGVRVAALTDHDTVSGLARFREVLTRAGVGCVSGVELSTKTESGAVHLLAYGFDPSSPELTEALRQARDTSAGGGLPSRRAAEVVHAAGGRLFLAHPLQVEPNLERLEERLRALKADGLDGLEAVYAPYSAQEILDLLHLAKKLGLAVSAGCDFHGPEIEGLSSLGINFPLEHWHAFRALLLASPNLAPPRDPPPAPPARAHANALDWRNFLWRIALPTAAALALLVVPLFTSVVPAFEDALLARKREMIRELTRSACSILEEYHQEELAGRLSRQEAQVAAAARVEFLRYGTDGKDYFWITDLAPKMVMHPYRKDLNGTDVGDFRDPRGHHVFVEFVRLVSAKREGYLEYVWQWKDDAQRLVPKQSYVRLFEPWGWVVGTGIYLEDVSAEISVLTGRIVRVSVFLAVVIALLLLFVAQQSFRLERRRTEAEESLRESHERYRALVEASREGTLMVLDGRSVFANQTFLELSGFGEGDLGLMELDELLEVPSAPGALAEWMRSVLASGPGASPVRARLRRRDGRAVDVLLAAESVHHYQQTGAVLIVRDLSAHQEMLAALQESQARFRGIAENLGVGVFRARVDARWSLADANSAARRLFGASEVDADPVQLADVFSDAGDLDALRAELLETGAVKARVLRLAAARGGARVAVSSTLVRDEAGAPEFMDGLVEDVTAREQSLGARDALIADLQTALLSLGEPVERVMREPVSVGLRTSIGEAAALMSRHDASALVVAAPSGEPLGLLTDHDFRSRIVALGHAPERPVFEVMSAPLITVSPSTQGHEALVLMRERRVSHLVVAERGGPVVGLVRGKDLLNADRYPIALLIRSIHTAETPSSVVKLRARLPLLVKALLDSGARPRHVCRAITSVTDALTQKLLAFAADEKGGAPTAFAYLALGSAGREEQTLLSDQDSALVFSVPSAGDASAAQAYFLELAERVGGWLEDAGYPACQGGVMARNPRWCQTLPAWRAQFSAWIHLGEPKNLLEFATFFDFRCIQGEAALAAELRAHVLSELAAAPAFLGHLAQATLQYKPPLGLFGNLLADAQGALDLKEALALLVHIGRLYALRHGIRETSTFDRFRRLHELGALSDLGSEELEQGYDLLMTLRLRHQADRLAANRPADNLIEPKNLSQLEQQLLKQVFSHVAVLQKKVGFDFLGSA